MLCPKCNKEATRGSIIVWAARVFTELLWIEGQPKTSFIPELSPPKGSIKLLKKPIDRYFLETYLCSSCKLGFFSMNKEMDK